jgi:hypothetical protein
MRTGWPGVFAASAGQSFGRIHRDIGKMPPAQESLRGISLYWTIDTLDGPLGGNRERTTLLDHLPFLAGLADAAAYGACRHGARLPLADGTMSFVQAVQEAVARNGEGERLRRKELAARNNWEARTERLLELVYRDLEALGPAA